MSRLVLIPVPGTRTGGAPVVRVVVVPRLDGGATVAEAGLPDWPATLAAATFHVVLDDGEPIPVAPVHEADGVVWDAFFGALRVDEATTATIGDPPTVRPTSREADDVEATYASAADVDVDPASARQANLGVASAKGLREHWQGRALEEPRPNEHPAAAPPPAPDFHRVLAMLREHPAVLRRLGLVFDLPVPADALADAGTVRVRWPDAPPGVPAVASPRSAYEVDDDRGLVPARSATARAGLVDLSDTAAWATTTLDVEGAVVRLRDAAESLPDAPEPDAAAAVDGAVRLPALRSAGIALLRRARGEELANRRAVAARRAGGDDLEDGPPLTADELTLGLRIDVRSKDATRWTSLMRRDARYTVNDLEVGPGAEEEGHVKPGAAVRQGETLHADEVVTRWSGWSLAVPARTPEPGRRRAPDVPFRFDWTFEVPPESLPRLRFSHGYHVRARVADLAGGGVGVEDRDVTMGTDVVTYTRHQPIAPPTVLVPEGDLGPGGAADLLVIRSDAPDYPPNDTRVLEPPTATLDLAEQHGRLDGRDEATLERVRRALAGGLPDPASAGVTLFPVPVPDGPPARTERSPWSTDWPDAPAKTLVLQARHDPDDAVIDPVEDVVRVRLAPAEELTVALSSFIPNGLLDHLAVHRWRSAGAPTDVITNGRHPMATPPREMTLVHAVRAPRGTPAGALAARQEPGAVAATLEPSPPMLGVDPQSTLQLQLAASWTEVDDDAEQRLERVAVHEVPVARGDRALREPLVHQFGDTRHRRVTYHPTAVSRFRHLYRPDEDAERFLARGDGIEVSVRSTARPAPPVVRAVVPAFRWRFAADGAVVRHDRSGGTLRVELARPWRLTGEGEQLAVVLGLSEAGRDPVWVTPPVGRVLSAQALAAAAPVPAALPDGTAVSLVPVDVAFAGDRWVADVGLPALGAGSYRPFVRLAVARYQRESLPGLELSEVVLTDMVQALPERTLTVDATASGQVVVRLDGVGPQGPRVNRVVVVAEVPGAPSPGDLGLLEPAALPAWAPAQTAVGGLGQAIVVARPPGAARLRVHEVESFADAEPTAASVGAMGERVVFTDLVTLG
jgi:hypothetical protein